MVLPQPFTMHQSGRTHFAGQHKHQGENPFANQRALWGRPLSRETSSRHTAQESPWGKSCFACLFLLFRGLADSQETGRKTKRKLWGEMVGCEICLGAQDRQKDLRPQTLTETPAFRALPPLCCSEARYAGEMRKSCLDSGHLTPKPGRSDNGRMEIFRGQLYSRDRLYRKEVSTAPNHLYRVFSLPKAQALPSLPGH